MRFNKIMFLTALMGLTLSSYAAPNVPDAPKVCSSNKDCSGLCLAGKCSIGMKSHAAADDDVTFGRSVKANLDPKKVYYLTQDRKGATCGDCYPGGRGGGGVVHNAVFVTSWTGSGCQPCPTA